MSKPQIKRNQNDTSSFIENSNNNSGINDLSRNVTN